jgi:ketosteroid isomerase-like protein
LSFRSYSYPPWESREAIIGAMSETARALVEKAIEFFNRDLGEGRNEPGADSRALWAPEPVIVPLRAALEGTEYRGPTAFDDFIADSLDSWSRLRIEPDEYRELDDQRLLVTGDLLGWARETGLETRARLAWLYVIDDGRIAEVRTFVSEQDALGAVRS